MSISSPSHYLFSPLKPDESRCLHEGRVPNIAPRCIRKLRTQRQLSVAPIDVDTERPMSSMVVLTPTSSKMIDDKSNHPSLHVLIGRGFQKHVYAISAIVRPRAVNSGHEPRLGGNNVKLARCGPCRPSRFASSSTFSILTPHDVRGRANLGKKRRPDTARDTADIGFEAFTLPCTIPLSRGRGKTLSWWRVDQGRGWQVLLKSLFNVEGNLDTRFAWCLVRIKVACDRED
ncbi:hypothetical protein B0T20DRAFT_465503 [Sordaria brevicollis]|uniref:Uncharacterized protein n=1 Tax=Sordaria brevicollis TaxID=83679 RepID=A0AAE0UFX4_SORBR|nr:hypothetical protein B0T20DRAFT_465503 [Sordaria brevicollis]